MIQIVCIDLKIKLCVVFPLLFFVKGIKVVDNLTSNQTSQGSDSKYHET